MFHCLGRAPAAFLLPAIPEAGRETVGGIQHINGVPIAESFYANDPEHPVTESCVLTLAEKESGRKAGLVSLEEVRAGKTAEAARSLQKEGRDLTVVDARSPGDLRAAKANNLLFYPIIPGQEEGSWEQFYDQIIDWFFEGKYTREVEDELIYRFNAHLPEKPSWG